MTVHKMIANMVLIGVLALTGCFRQDLITVEIEVPAMRTAEDRAKVLQALSGLEKEAVQHADLDAESQKVTITYNSTRLARKNIEHAIAAAGYDANEIKARP